MSEHDQPQPPESRSFDRRSFFALAGLAGGAAATAYVTRGSWAGGDASEAITAGTDPATGEATAAGVASGDSPSTSALGTVPTVPNNGRSLVVIELAGGNDGINTLAPMAAGAYFDMRPGLALSDEDAIDFGDGFGLHPSLSRLADRGVAAVAGVGSRLPEGSHFEMMQRWWAGDSDGVDVQRGGVLGRSCDLLAGNGGGISGASIGRGPSPIIHSERGSSLGLPSADAMASFRGGDSVQESIRAGLRGMTAGDAPELVRARSGLATALDVVDVLAEMPEPANEFPGSRLGRDLAEASRILRAGVGIQVIHVELGGFDTHDDQNGRHANLLGQIDEGVDAFLREIDDMGLSDSVVVATISEFGRRPLQNSSGTDHGAASVALLAGAVNSGVFGEYPSLTDLDDGNLQATVDMESYYATLLEGWLGLPADEVFAQPTNQLDNLFRV